MSDLAGLIERVEKATGPDHHGIDTAILRHLGFTWRGMAYWNQSETQIFKGSTFFTSSVDAAIALVDFAMPGAWYVIAKGRLTSAEPLYGCELLFGSDEQLGIADGPTQPLAIVLALLRALQAKP